MINPSLDPLVALLRQELQAVGETVPADALPHTVADFTGWYLQAIQTLESSVARRGRHAPMSRREVELMCRSCLSATDLGEAISMLQDFSAMLQPRAGRITLRRKGDQLVFQLNSQRQQISTASNLVDITGLFAFCQLLNWLCGRELPLVQVGIGPIPRDDLLPFLTLFNAPVLAGGDDYALVFPRRVLDWPLCRDRSEFSGFFAGFPCAVFAGVDEQRPRQVQALLQTAAMQGRPLPSFDAIAGSLEVAGSTLRRQLRLQGTGYRALRVESLQKAACALLLEGARVATVAQRLGFSDDTAFRRAFRQWFGLSPIQWKKRTQSGMD